MNNLPKHQGPMQLHRLHRLEAGPETNGIQQPKGIFCSKAPGEGSTKPSNL